MLDTRPLLCFDSHSMRRKRYSYKLSINLTATQHAAIETEATLRGVDLAAVVREFIVAGLLAQERPVETAREVQDGK